jgi:methylated-DNA-[protein]-cysteine S-methyltransferase
MFDAILDTPIGLLGIQFDKAKLKSIQFVNSPVVPMPFVTLSSTAKKIAKRFEAFFSFAQNLHDLPYVLHGTPFQKRVWQALCKIPLGETRCYGDLAKKLDTSARAIGMACRTNPLPIIVPCHRIVAANDIGGYCGQTSGNKLSIKQWLLAHERSSC